MLRNGTEDYGDGGVYDARQQGDERHVNAIHRGTKRADRINREANDEASHKFRSDTKCQRLALFFLGYGRCFNSSHSLSSVI